MRDMAVPEEIRTRLSRWCADRVPDTEREQRQIAYTIQGGEVTILDRRPPAYPELGAAWSATPLAQLRQDDPESGMWSLYRPAGERDWRREFGGDDPLALLDRVTV
jgi:hypothetical protein